MRGTGSRALQGAVASALFLLATTGTTLAQPLQPALARDIPSPPTHA